MVRDRMLAVAADVADAIDPALPAEDRRAAARRAAEAHPLLAIALATTYAHLMLETWAGRDPDAVARAVQQMRVAASKVGL